MYRILDLYGVCAFDDENNRILSDYFEESDQMTIEICISICRSKGFPYARLEWQIECHCGYEPDVAFEWAWSDKCNERCPGDYNQICGSANAMNVWTTPLNYFDGLCINDFPENRRVLNEFSITGLRNLTVDYCESICEGKNFHILLQFLRFQTSKECI